MEYIMNIGAPTKVVFFIALILGVVGILGMFGLVGGIPYLKYLLPSGFVLLVLGVLIPNL
jgi:hypothetical protein